MDNISEINKGGFLPPPQVPPWRQGQVSQAPSDIYSRSQQQVKPHYSVPKVVPLSMDSPQGTSTMRAMSGFSPDMPEEWVAGQASHNGTWFEVIHPKGWKLVNTPNALLVINPYDKNALVSFMWFNGMGKSDPKTLIDNTVAYNGLTDYRVLHSTPVSIIQTPAGPYKIMEQDAEYNYRGERCRHHLMSEVSDNNDPYFLFWSGSMVWCQAPADKWEKYSPTLYQISSSFKIVPAPPPPGPVCTYGNGG